MEHSKHDVWTPFLGSDACTFYTVARIPTQLASEKDKAHHNLTRQEQVVGHETKQTEHVARSNEVHQ